VPVCWCWYWYYSYASPTGLIEVEPELVGAAAGKKVKVPLNSNDKLFHEVRNMNFSRIGPLLNRKAKEIDEYYRTRHGAQTVTQIRDFMRKLSTTQQEHNLLRIRIICV
jgi:hypothetical protein